MSQKQPDLTTIPGTPDESGQLISGEPDEYGETYELLTEPCDEGDRLDVMIAKRALMTRSAAQKLIESGLVTLDGRAVQKRYKPRAGELFSVTLPPPVSLDAEAEDIPLDIVYEDASLIVVDKPKGMVVHPAAGNYSGTLVNALLWHCGDSLSGIGGVIRPGIVHRIDKDTSGLLVVAKNDEAHLSLASQIKAHTATRRYEAIVAGNLRDDEGIVNAPIGRHPSDRKKMAVVAGGREAVTHYRVLGRYESGGADFTHIECRLETGRTHQIRVHMAHIGHHVIGDPLYGGGGSCARFEQKYAEVLRGQCLHARILGFDHPVTGERMEFSSELPEYFKRVLSVLGGKGVD